MHGQLGELVSSLERALATPATLDAHTRAEGLRTLGRPLNFTEQYDRSREPLEQSLTLFRELGDRSGEASVLMSLGMGYTNQGSHAQAIDLFRAALAMARGKGDKPGLANALNLVAGCFFEMGELEPSKDAIEEALAIHSKLGAYSPAAADLGTLADIALAQGDHQQAERHSREALKVIRATAMSATSCTASPS